MITAEQCFLDMVNSPVRNIRARVELYNGSTLLNTFKYTDLLKELTIERVGEENKFFGFGICQKANVKVLDKDRLLDITTANTLDIAFGTGCDYLYPCPYFKVSEVHRSETTNELSITAYDALYQASKHTVAELVLPTSYTIETFATACASLLGLPIHFILTSAVALPNPFLTEYPNGANFDGTETIREALNAVAEATQTIYYVDNEQRLTFKRLNKDDLGVYAIDKNRYIELDSGTNRRLAQIVHATELGDNVSSALDVSGTTQYVRDNPFWDLREDIGTLVQRALTAVGGLTINQFECSWRGNFLLEIGDKVLIQNKDGGLVNSFILDDVISYNGVLSQKTKWKYTSSENETAANPATLGDALKQTFARVDKANKEITLLASDISENTESIANLNIKTDEIAAEVGRVEATANANTESISSLIINTDNIAASVSKIETDTSEALEGINSDISTLTNRVEASITADDVSIQIQSELTKGVDKITTSTGYTFDSDGLTINKSGSEMTTQITEDGMIVNKNGEAVLTANNVGVNATNLHATTYLIVGTNSRFEDYNGRTGCFWIGEG